MSTPGRRRAVLAGIGAVLLGGAAAAVLWVVGLPVVWAVAVGIAAAALTVAWVGLSALDVSLPLQVDPPPRAGTRADIVQLSWSLRPVRTTAARLRAGARPVHEAGVRRLRRLAARRLAVHGLDLASPADRPAIERRLGPEVAAVLVAATDAAVTLPAINACLDALDALDPDRKGTPSDDR